MGLSVLSHCRLSCRRILNLIRVIFHPNFPPEYTFPFVLRFFAKLSSTYIRIRCFKRTKHFCFASPVEAWRFRAAAAFKSHRNFPAATCWCGDWCGDWCGSWCCRARWCVGLPLRRACFSLNASVFLTQD